MYVLYNILYKMHDKKTQMRNTAKCKTALLTTHWILLLITEAVPSAFRHTAHSGSRLH